MGAFQRAVGSPRKIQAGRHSAASGIPPGEHARERMSTIPGLALLAKTAGSQVTMEKRASLMQAVSERNGGIAGRLKLGVNPSALAMVSALTERIEAERLDTECYCLFVPSSHPWAARASATAAEAVTLPLVLLTPGMQNRRIIDTTFARGGVQPVAEIETDSVITLWSHLRYQGWASVMPEYVEHLFGRDGGVRALPLCEPTVRNDVGLVTVEREPLPPLIGVLHEVCRSRVAG